MKNQVQIIAQKVILINSNLGVDNLKPNFEGKIKEVEKDQVL